MSFIGNIAAAQSAKALGKYNQQAFYQQAQLQRKKTEIARQAYNDIDRKRLLINQEKQYDSLFVNLLSSGAEVRLGDSPYEVLLETSGSLTIENVPKKVINIIDFKCPSSGMKKKNYWDNTNYLKSTDEVKFIIEDRKDYEWCKMKIKKYNLDKKCTVLISPSYKKIQEKQIAEWILEDNLNVKFQVQLHKVIWEDSLKGV